MRVPAYLATPADGEKFEYGRLEYEDGYYYILNAVPSVFQMAKRLFPGSDFGGSGRRGRSIRFRATRRAVGDLNWLMLRYPLEVTCPGLFEDDRQKAISHALRRETNQVLAPVTPPAVFTGELQAFQGEGVGYLLANERTLLADDMGLGKTVMGLAALATAEAFPALVVAPTNVTSQWQRKAAEFLDLPHRELFPLPDGSSHCHIIQGLKPYDLPDRHIYIIHYGLLRGWGDALSALPLKAIIFDEIQELRHDQTKKYAVASRLASEVDLAWGLSGTPIYGYGVELCNVMNILDHLCLGDHGSFTREWCTGYGTKTIEDPAALNDHLQREGLMLRRRKSDVAGQLPPKRRVVETVDHDGALYEELIRPAVAAAHSYDTISGWRERGQAALEIEGASRRAAGLSKVPAVVDFVSVLLEGGEKPLVYAWHHDVHDAIISGLQARNWKCGEITGRQSKAQKQAAVDAFTAGTVDMVQMSLRSAAGIDGLQGTASCVVFAELDWSPGIHSQCEDRGHRMGMDETMESLLCYYLVSQTGYDGVVRDALGLKIGQFIGLMGDKAETQKDRALAQRAAKEQLTRIITQLKAHPNPRMAQAS